MTIRFSFFILAFFIYLFFSHSQPGSDPDYQRHLNHFREAKALYDEATALSLTDTYDEEKEMNLNREALKEFYDLYSKISAGKTRYDSLQFHTAFLIGELEHYLEHLEEAKTGYRNSIEIARNSHLPDSILFRPYLYSGNIFYRQNKFDSASAFFEKAEAIQNKYSVRLRESERLFNILGVLYYEKGDYRQARNYFMKAMETLAPHHPYYKELSVNYRINLAQVYFKLENYEEANVIYQELLPFKTNLNEIYHNLGTINLQLGAAEKALLHYRKVNYSTNKVIRLYNNTAMAFMELDKIDSALFYLEKAWKANDSLGKNSDPSGHGLTLKNLGDLEMIHNRPLSALSFYQQSLLQFYPTYNDTSIRSNPVEFSGVFSYIQLFNALVAKAEAFDQLWVQTKNLDWAKEELNSYKSAFRLITYVERTYDSDEARLFINRFKYVVHSRPIDIAYTLYSETGLDSYLNDLYLFDQQTKASVLALQKRFYSQAAKGDTSLLAKEKKIRSEISRLSIRASLINDSAALAELNKKIRDNEMELGRLQDQLSETSVVTDKLPSISFIQENILDKSSAIISYHLSEDKLTTLVIDPSSVACFQKTLYPGFHEEIEKYVTGMKEPANMGTAPLANKLFNFLLGNLELPHVERLLIIPDDELNYLPFESLQEDNGQYLVEKFSIQYLYTTALLKKETIDFSNHQTLAMAPFISEEWNSSTEVLEKLPFSGPEVETLEGKVLLDEEATKRNFLEQLSGYEVIHLATHAVVNNEKDNLSFIAFYPEGKQKQDFLMYSEEIYHLPLQNTRLVILSACETGLGSLVKGEGIMSMSRAFAYAGSPNIITTLWNANDFSTAYLTTKVHHYLDEKYTIDRALQLAKIDYLNDRSIHPRLKHPFYWTHLVFVGNYGMQRLSFNIPWWLVLTAFGILLLWIIRKTPGEIRRVFHRRRSLQ